MRSHLTSRYFAYALIAVLAGSALFAGLPAVQQSYASHKNIAVDLDEIEYGQGDDVVISGSIEDVNDDEDTVQIRVTKASGGSTTDEAELRSNGDFDFVYELANSAADGIYTVKLTYDGESVYSYFLVNEDDDDVRVVLGDDSYDPGDNVEISGEVDSVTGADEVEITVLDPSNDELLDSQNEDVDEDDEFSHDFDLDDDAEHGRYAVTVTYNDEDFGYAIFEVNEDSSEPITMQLSKTNYTPGATVRVTGEVDDVVNNKDVEIVVTDSDDDSVYDDSVEPESDGAYEFAFVLDDDAVDGTYKVTVSYNGDDVDATFTVSESTSSGGSSTGDITVKLNKASYLAGDSMTVTGKVPKKVTDAMVNIDIFHPDGTFALVTASVDPESDLTYSATLKLRSDLDVDQGYTVRVNYGTYSGQAEFAITGKSSSSSGLTVKTDKSEYEIGSSVKITGTISSGSIVEGQKVLIQVNKPDGNPYRIDIVEPSSSGSYTYTVVIGGELAISGEYKVVATYGSEKASAEFELAGPPQATKYSLKIEGKSYPIEYEIDGGTVKSMFVQPSDNKLVVSIDAEEDGQLVLVLPRSVIDSVEDGQVKPYIVATADLEAGVGSDASIRESDTTDDARTIVIDYKAGTDLIEISGTSVVPEFGPVSAIVLAVAIVGIIVASARFQKLSFFK